MKQPASLEALRAQSAALQAARTDDPSTWFDRHLETSMCRCVIGAPDSACDQGEALFRLQVATIAGNVFGWRQPLLRIAKG